MAKRKLPASIPPDPLVSFGKAAIANARELADEARLLAAHGHWSRATALMLTAREEGGKGFYAVLLGIGAMPEKRPKDRGQVSSIKALLQLHGPKLAFAAVLDGVVAMWAKCRKLPQLAEMAVQLDADPKDLGEVEALVGRLMLQLRGLKPDEACVQGLVASAGEAFEAEFVAGRSELLRQRAFYVDVMEDGISVRTPGEVGEKEYRQQVKSFRRAERILRVFGSAEYPPEALSMMRSMFTRQRE